MLQFTVTYSHDPSQQTAVSYRVKFHSNVIELLDQSSQNGVQQPLGERFTRWWYFFEFHSTSIYKAADWLFVAFPPCPHGMIKMRWRIMYDSLEFQYTKLEAERKRRTTSISLVFSPPKCDERCLDKVKNWRGKKSIKNDSPKIRTGRKIRARVWQETLLWVGSKRRENHRKKETRCDERGGSRVKSGKRVCATAPHRAHTYLIFRARLHFL